MVQILRGNHNKLVLNCLLKEYSIECSTGYTCFFQNKNDHFKLNLGTNNRSIRLKVYIMSFLCIKDQLILQNTTYMFEKHKYLMLNIEIAKMGLTRMYR